MVRVAARIQHPRVRKMAQPRETPMILGRFRSLREEALAYTFLLRLTAAHLSAVYEQNGWRSASRFIEMPVDYSVALAGTSFRTRFEMTS
jgi:hypothetical protein